MIVEQCISPSAGDGDDGKPAPALQAITDNELIKKLWFRFFEENKTGCFFAAMVAKAPNAYGWFGEITHLSAEAINQAIQKAIIDPGINTISLIFPGVKTQADLAGFLEVLNEVQGITVESQTIYDGHVCLAYRLKVGKYSSWVTGFGPFDFLPQTRRAPFAGITLRVKPKPVYEWVLKASKETELHLADMDINVLKEIPRATFEQLWKMCFKRVKFILGHDPDLKSAAKTTYNLPIERSYGK
ncbi:hypothetical protein [Mucilaginibacter sp.]|jgi:hypothetical protein|uniref:hypothetical protein n=1 Tax=Mucilaginibacter sp. TaxID=1882438 RepID=UPI002B5B935E|nr:hypothetical protein [Mucilaginibacter sp.]HTI60113.1 hypothetical protein [Mucilaginibacter sp.]